MTDSPSKSPLYWPGLVGILLVKVLLHVLTWFSDYSFHRDEYLYLNMAEHLDWGYLEVPPVIALIAKVSQLTGHGMGFVRIWPLLAGLCAIYLVAKLTQHFGGGRMAQLLAMTAWLCSPAFLGTNNLFQPVSFNQLMWLLSAYLLVRVADGGKARDWYAFGLVVGIGFLTKYSIVFFVLALVSAFLGSQHRRQLRAPHPWLALLLALVIASPNLYWQYDHNWPVIGHMNELARTQLVHMTTMDFLLPQLLFHWAGGLVWIAGLLALCFWRPLRAYRFLGVAFLLTVGLLLALSGKAYYTLGAYSMLLAGGAVWWEARLRARSGWLLPIIVLLNAPLWPYGLPLLAPERMITYGQTMGIEPPLRWEDGVVRALPQDYADMLGWQELPAKVAELYHGLSPAQQASCLLYGGGYGHSGVLNYYRKAYDLPYCYSFSSSNVLWLQRDLDISCQIQLDDNWQASSETFAQVTLVDSIAQPLARDPGYLYLKTEPIGDLRPVWNSLVEEFQAPYRRPARGAGSGQRVSQ